MSYLLKILCFSFIYECLSSKLNDNNTISIHKNGPIEYCNVNPYEWNFKPLKATDLLRIRKLSQVHILARHGTRIISDPIKSIFPNSNLSWTCNFTTVVTRHFKGQKLFVSFQFHFVDNEQIIEGNCQVSSSLSPVIEQHRANANMVKKFYIGRNRNHLMTETELEAIGFNILTNANENNQNTVFETKEVPEIKILAANYERTITSATVFMSQFLEIPSQDVTMELFIHDTDSDPYSADDSAICTKLSKYIRHSGKVSKQFQRLKKSEKYKYVKKKWESEVGSKFNYPAAASATLMYCGGLDVPISMDFFHNTLNISYEMKRSAAHNNENSKETMTLAAMPTLYIFKKFITNKIFDEYNVNYNKTNNINTKYFNYLRGNKARLIYHSVHDWTILWILEALGISNGKQPMFAEMLTLEIYKKDVMYDKYDEVNQLYENFDMLKYWNPEQYTLLEKRYEFELFNEYFGNYLFRFTRKGLPIGTPDSIYSGMFPGCEAEFALTESNLCDLRVLMKMLIEKSMPIKKWEPFCKNITEEYFTVNNIQDDDGSASVLAVNNVDTTKMFNTHSIIVTLFIGIMLGIGITILFYKIIVEQRCSEYTKL